MSRWGPRVVWPRLAAVTLAVCLGCGAGYAVRHTVRAGDTVAALARRYGVSEAELRRYNQLQKGDRLRRGDMVFVPGARADRGHTPAPPAAPAPPAVAASVAPPPKPRAPARGHPGKAPPSSRATLGWPVTGAVLRGFGRGPAGDSRGIDVAAEEGATVGAAADGTVTYAGTPAAAYGTIVIVEHPGKLFTVYSQLGSAAVAKGAGVKRGEAVGTVAAGKPAHLHFEVRREEKAVDPLLFLPPR